MGERQPRKRKRKAKGRTDVSSVCTALQVAVALAELFRVLFS